MERGAAHKEAELGRSNHIQRANRQLIGANGARRQISGEVAVPFHIETGKHGDTALDLDAGKEGGVTDGGLVIRDDERAGGQRRHPGIVGNQISLNAETVINLEEIGQSGGACMNSQIPLQIRLAVIAQASKIGHETARASNDHIAVELGIGEIGGFLCVESAI